MKKFPELLADFLCELVSLELERTFWEKATILHAEYHRNAARPIRDPEFEKDYLAIWLVFPNEPPSFASVLATADGSRRQYQSSRQRPA